MTSCRGRLAHAGAALAAPLLAAVTIAGCAHRRAPPCPDTGAALVVASHRACLCEAGRAVRVYPVAIGRAGLGKKVQGDDRSPTGVYSLGTPRPSSKFHTFIPIGYPSAAQREAGFTGSDIGLHGPPRGWRRAGRATVWFDWTRGCIAFSSDAAIDEVAAWVRDHPGARVEIR